MRSALLPVLFVSSTPPNEPAMLRFTNMLTDNQMSVETSTAGWVDIGATISRDTTRAVHGSASLKTVVPGTYWNEGNVTLTGTSGVPVTEGERYAASFWLYVETSGYNSLYATIFWYTSGGSFLSASESAEITPTAGLWARYEVVGDAPTGAAYAAIGLNRKYPFAATWWTDGHIFEVAKRREGETHIISWTEASPLDADGDAVTYRIQFSETGNFSDAVTLASGIPSGTTIYAWDIPVGTVSADTSTARLRLRAEDSTGMVSAWLSSAAFTLLT